jgi:integrase/recombinase XerD
MAKRKFKAALKVETTLYEAFEEFHEEKQAKNLSAATLRNYKQSFNAFCEYHQFDEDTLLETIELPLFYKWINHMKNDEIRPQSINHHLRDWRTFLNWCYEREKIPEPIKVKEIEAQEGLPKMYSDEEMAVMLEKPRQGDGFSDWRSWAIISTVYATGLRASTLCALTLEDLNFQREEIVIEKQKNKHAGVLPLTAALANVLNEYIKKWMRDAEPTDWLFPSITGEQFNVCALNHSIKRYCEARGFAGHGIHSVRHNFARDMIINGAGEYRLQRYLQHSNIQMSQHYVKLFSADLKNNAEEYSPLDNAKKKAKRTSAFKKG